MIAAAWRSRNRMVIAAGREASAASAMADSRKTRPSAQYRRKPRGTLDGGRRNIARIQLTVPWTVLPVIRWAQ